MFTLVSRKRSLWFLVGITALAAVAGAGWWWHHTRRPDYRLQRGREAIGRDDWDEAYSIAEQLEAAGESDRALLLRGEALVHQKYFAKALESFNGIRDQEGLRFQAAVLSGRCLLELHQLREAHRAYSWVLEQQPEQIDAHRGLAAIAYDLGQLPQAVHHLEEVGRLDPADGRPYRLIGLIQKDLSRLPEAEAAYQEALRRHLPPGFRQTVQRERVEVLLRQHRFPETLTLLDQLRDDPRPDDTAARAEALVGSGRNDEARAVLDPALRSNPHDARLLRLRGQLHLQERQPEEAVKRLEQAVKFSPRDEIARYHLGLAYAAVGNSKSAAEQQARVTALRAELQQLTDLSSEAMKKPWDASVRVKLAALCEKMDKPQLAAMWREAAKACQAGR